MKPFILRVEQSVIGPYAAQPGDLMLVRPAAERALVLQRALVARYAPLLAQFRAGVLSAAEGNADAIYAELVALAALEQIESLPTPPPPPRRGRRSR